MATGIAGTRSQFADGDIAVSFFDALMDECGGGLVFFRFCLMRKENAVSARKKKPYLKRYQNQTWKWSGAGQPEKETDVPEAGNTDFHQTAHQSSMKIRRVLVSTVHQRCGYKKCGSCRQGAVR